eukprot:13605533-Heterocapsa_arctica.AAC.1
MENLLSRCGTGEWGRVECHRCRTPLRTTWFLEGRECSREVEGRPVEAAAEARGGQVSSYSSGRRADSQRTSTAVPSASRRGGREKTREELRCALGSPPISQGHLAAGRKQRKRDADPPVCPRGRQG